MLLAFALLAGCRSPNYSPATFPDGQLTFGSGGGFTGQVTEYTLLENGQLFETNSLTKETKELKRVGSSARKQLWAATEKLELEKRDFNHPGNQYTFLQRKRGPTTHRVTWGNPDHPVPDDIRAVHQQLVDQVSKQ
ncbi:MAG: hypothetical protein H7Z75_23075 [Ferruginibacter sp.]|nr:hypothetical protein [Cytophagales bacterium]